MAMILVNLRRTMPCNLCETLVEVEDNRKLHGDERDRAQLCRRCERTIRAEVRAMKESRRAEI